MEATLLPRQLLSIILVMLSFPLGPTILCQDAEIEIAQNQLQLLEAEKKSLQKRLQEIDNEIRNLSLNLEVNSEATWELEVKTVSVSVLQAAYEYATPVRIEGRPWKLAPGQRISVIGAIDRGAKDFWQVSDGDRTGYVKDLFIDLYRNGTKVPYSKLEEAAKSLTALTRNQFIKNIDDKDFIIFGIFPDGPNSAGGVGARIAYRLLEISKPAKYISFTVTPFNAVGDLASDRVSGKSQQKLKVTGPIDSRPLETEEFDEEASWDLIWYNNSISCLRLDRVDIEYIDGTKKILINQVNSAIYPEFNNSCTLK